MSRRPCRTDCTKGWDVLRTIVLRGNVPTALERALCRGLGAAGPSAGGEFSGGGQATGCGKITTSDLGAPSSFGAGGAGGAVDGVCRWDCLGAAMMPGRELEGRAASTTAVLDRRRLPGFRAGVGALTLVRLGRRGGGFERAEEGPSDGDAVLRTLLVRAERGLPWVGPGTDPTFGVGAGSGASSFCRARRGMVTGIRDRGDAPSSAGTARTGTLNTGISPSGPLR
jgi:hypothetical protein